jgi:hypothetical protein
MMLILKGRREKEIEQSVASTAAEQHNNIFLLAFHFNNAQRKYFVWVKTFQCCRVVCEVNKNFALHTERESMKDINEKFITTKMSPFRAKFFFLSIHFMRRHC